MRGNSLWKHSFRTRAIARCTVRSSAFAFFRTADFSAQRCSMPWWERKQLHPVRRLLVMRRGSAVAFAGASSRPMRLSGTRRGERMAQCRRDSSAGERGWCVYRAAGTTSRASVRVPRQPCRAGDRLRRTDSPLVGSSRFGAGRRGIPARPAAAARCDRRPDPASCHFVPSSWMTLEPASWSETAAFHAVVTSPSAASAS